MRHTMKLTLASLVLLPLASAWGTVKAPHPGTVTSTTYTTSGSFHGAVDIADSRCGYWSVLTPLVGSVYWNVTIYSTTLTCTTPSGNTAVHVFADGWSIRIKNFLKSAASVDKTCDRCEIGKVGNHTHIQNDKSGTLDTSWYSGYTTNGETIDAGETIGVLN